MVNASSLLLNSEIGALLQLIGDVPGVNHLLQAIHANVARQLQVLLKSNTKRRKEAIYALHLMLGPLLTIPGRGPTCKWRKGPDGEFLCNSCGLQWAKKAKEKKSKETEDSNSEKTDTATKKKKKSKKGRRDREKEDSDDEDSENQVSTKLSIRFMA